MIVLAILALITGFAFKWTAWGRHVFAIGGNEQAAILTGVPVKRIKISVYMFASLTAGITGVLEVGWLGGVTTNLGQGMELSVIAAAVIGGANLAGGVGTAFGAVVGAALIEVIRNSLILLGHQHLLAGRLRRQLHHPRGAVRPHPDQPLERVRKHSRRAGGNSARVAIDRTDAASLKMAAEVFSGR